MKLKKNNFFLKKLLTTKMKCVNIYTDDKERR